MPIYEFSCTGCGKRFEKLLLKRDQKVTCPACTAESVQRLMSVCSFGSSDGKVKAASSAGCSSCTSSSCHSCGGR